MRRCILGLVFLLSACSSVSDVTRVGPDTFMVSSMMRGQFPPATWYEVKELGMNKANEFCLKQRKLVTVVDTKTRGARGWTPQETDITFKCE